MVHLRAALQRLRCHLRPRFAHAIGRYQDLNPNFFSTVCLQSEQRLRSYDKHLEFNVLQCSGRRLCSQRCNLSSSSADGSQSTGSSSSSETISVTFVDKHGDEKTIKVPFGTSMLEAAHQNDIELEGACEGSLACSTCHVIVMDEKYYNKLPEPTDEENDMLDLAFGLTETSRLGCQVIAKPELDGMRLVIPSATRNFAVDGYVPKPH